MLKIARCVRDLDFDRLMDVYTQSNQLAAKRLYPHCTEYEQKMRLQEFFYSSLLAFFRESGAFYALWVQQGNYASALRVESFQDGVIITGLETAPRLRGQGFATALLQAVLGSLGESGISTVYSHVDKKNRASLAVHKKCGFRVISDYAKLLDGTVTYELCTLKR